MNLMIFVIFFYLERVSSVDSYRYLKIYDRDVCPHVDTFPSLPIPKPLKEFFDPTNKLKLESGRDSAVIVEQTMEAKSFHKKFEINCVFKIDASKRNKGLFIIVKRLNFRLKDPYQCRDYIRVEFGNKTKSEKVCGIIGQNDEHKAFIDESGKVKVEINIDTRTPLEDFEDPIQFSIVFTGYSTCTNDRKSCFPKTRDPASLEPPPIDDHCISNHFWHDHIVNCPGDCLDEDGCMEPEVEPLLQPSTIFVSAMTSLIFTMVIFGTCLWFCFKYKDCSNGGARDVHNARQRSYRAPINIELQTPEQQAASRSLNAMSPTRPTAPEKHDLPPSYDDLFPSS